jgi:pimeloyl-ACP methyl ester carboxylesterase
VILDSVYPPDVNLFTESPTNRWQALDALLDTCAEDTACNTMYADVRNRLSQTVTALNANPEVIFLSFPNENTHPVRFNGNLMLEMLASFMYDSDLLPFMPYIITEASEGNLRPFQDYLGYQFLRQTEVSNGMYMAVQCREELAFTQRGDIREAQQPLESRFGYTPTGIQNDDYLNICATFNTGTPAPAENQAIASDVPALLLTGTYDPVTPPRWAYQAAETLINSRVIEFPAQGHGVTAGDACGQQLLSDFVQSPVGALESLDTSCVDELTLDFYQGAPVDASADTS